MYEAILKHWGIFVSLVLVAGLFAIGFINQDVYGPPHAKPEKIKVGPIKPTAEGFDLDISLHCSFGTAGHNADFRIHTTLTIQQDSETKGVIVVTSKVKDVVRTTNCNQGDDKFGKIKVKFPWDRDRGTVDGLVDVIVDAKILNPAGKPVGSGQVTEDLQVVIPSCEESCEVKALAVFEACSAAESVLGIPLECSKIVDETHVRCISSCGTGEERTCEECCLSALDEIIPLCGGGDDCRMRVADAFLTTCAGTCEELS